MSWWAFSSAFSWNKPTEIKGLRLHTEHKLTEYYPKGNFWFTLESKADKLPTLIISSKPAEAVRDEYKKLAAPAKADEFIVGTYESKGKAGEGTYTFTIDMATNAAYANKLIKDKDLSLKFWSSFAIAQPSAVTFNGTPLMKRKMVDVKWDVCVWNLSRLLTLKAKEGVLDSAPLPGQWVPSSDGKSQKFVMPNGVTLAESMPVKVEAEGTMVDKAKDSALIMQMMRDPVTAIMKEQGEALKKKLIEIDEKTAATEKGDKKPKTEKLLKETIEQFERDFSEACIKVVHEEWCKYVVNNIEYKQYVYDCRVSVAKSAVTVGLGIAGAAVGGLGGPAAILGLIGTIKGALDMANDLYGMYRDIDGLSKELDFGLNGLLAKYKSDKNFTATLEVFKTFLDSLPGGSVTKSIAAKVGAAHKDINTLDKDVKTYTGRVKGFLPKGEETAKGLDKFLSNAEAAREELAKTIKLGGKNKKQLESLNKKTEATAAAVTKLLDDVIDNFKKWDAGLKKSTEYSKILEAIKKESPKAAEIIKAAMPALGLVYAVDPANVAGLTLAVISAAADMTKGLIDALKASEEDPKSETGKKIAEMLKEAADQAGNINAFVGLFKS